MNIAFAERPVTTAPHGMVTCPHALASQAGVDVLKAGGSAVDAAIAAGSTLAVIYPHMTGLGGDAFWLIYDAKAPTPTTACAPSTAAAAPRRMRVSRHLYSAV